MKVIYLPANLNLEKLITENPPIFKYEIEDFKYLIGTIVRLKVEIKSNTDEHEPMFVPLNAQILQSRIRNYNRCLEYLIEHGIIERDYYIIGEKARGYRLAKVYATVDFKPEELRIRRLIKKNAASVIRYRNMRRHYGYLTKWFNENLLIDKDAAEAHLRYMLENDKSDTREEKFRLRMIAVDKIARGLFNYSVDDTSGRFHSNLTNLKSELRNFITYDNHKLCAIDVNNCQPFISTILLDKSFYQEKKGEFNLFSISSSHFKILSPVIPQILSILSNSLSPIMLVKNDESEAQTDLGMYCTLVDKGRFYQFISEQYHSATGIHLRVDIPEEKRKLKDAMFLTLYSSNRFYKQKGAEMKRFFDQQFPTVYKVFSLLKSKGHSILPIILQRIESEIFINRVCKALSKNYPKLPIFTIHDSVVTINDQTDIPYNNIKREFELLTNLKPSLSTELWVNN